MPQCASIGCTNITDPLYDFCFECSAHKKTGAQPSGQPMSSKYPKYFKDVSEITEVDVYHIHNLFEIEDASGCIHHASKKLLLSGVRTGGKSKYQDIKEARDTLNRWLELNSL
jgi:hypothetical protein